MSNGSELPAQATGLDNQIVTFLHLSDLHVGMSPEGWLWPAVKSAFYADVKALLPQTGLPDIVIFSGDLVQRATREEYERLTELLCHLWEHFRGLGCNPVFIPVPGNHDLSRQPKSDLAGKALRSWWSDPDVPKDFWADTPGYRDFVARSFENYQRFCSALSMSSVPTPTGAVHGLIPGDIAVRVPVREQSIGVVGLNSAWLQVGEGDFMGQLDVDPRQLLAVIGDDPDAWCREQTANLLVTHHPESWLHPDSQTTWRSDIYCGTRFDCHLFGHMHEQRTSVVADGGFQGRRLFQGASLFGLEWVGERRVERIHGYSVGQILAQGQTRRLRQWPRQDLVGINGVRKLAPNHKFNLLDNQYFDIEYSADTAAPTSSGSRPLIAVRGDKKVLEVLRRILPASEPARHVRRIEQQMCLDVLARKRLVWIAADWGLGADEFLEAMIARLEPVMRKVFQFDLGHYCDRSDMLDGIFRDFGTGFQQICESISHEPGCIVIFDDVDVTTDTGGPNIAFVDALGDIASAVLQYCPDARLVIRSRRRPVQTSIDVFELSALNDLDVMLYIQNHPAGGIDIATESFVHKIVGHTDGLPSRIDEALRDVELLGLDGLHLVDSDVSGKAASPQPSPPGLAETIARLESDADPNSLRAFRLLSVLSLFPRGEYLESVRRFESARPFYPQDAYRLVDLGLIETTEISSIGASTPGTNAKSLVVKRPVREYLIGHLSAETVEKINRQALALYFGDQWRSGAIKPPKGTRFDERTCENWKIDNATLLILREAKEAMEAAAELRIANAATLASSYCTALHNGQHYGSLIRAATDFLAIYRDMDSQKLRLASIEALLGRALRMSGFHQEAMSVLHSANEAHISNSVKSSVLIALTLASESLGETENAIDFARQCIALDKHSRNALQARSVIVGIKSEGNPQRKEKLLKLARSASKRGAQVIANNLRLLCMQEAEDDTEKITLARQVIEGAAADDHDDYNVMRAMLWLCKIAVFKGIPLSDSDLTRVIGAYHYLLNESMDQLFGLAHKVLWRHFLLTGDTGNLLSLFRHSSFKWHLRGKSAEDRNYATEVLELLDGDSRGGSIRSTREVTYLMLRAGQSLKLIR